MVAINFDARFAGLVEEGLKTCTVRKGPKGKPGDRLQLYTGQRSKGCRRLVNPDPVLLQVVPIEIGEDYAKLGDAAPMTGDRLAILGASLGFDDYAGAVAFYRERHGLPAKGVPFRGFFHSWG